jgi:feruloyl esterase
MPGLADTTAFLAHLRRHSATPAPGIGNRAGPKLVSVDFKPNPGALRMLVHIPQTLKGRAPLVVVLHGCTQTGAGYADAAGWLTLADRYGFALLAPEQTAQNNSNRCFNWFEPKNTTRGQGEVASIKAMVDAMIRDHRVDPRRVFVTGLSAGGAMTAALLATYPEVFSAGAIIAGLPYGVADSLQSALTAMYTGGTHSAADLGDRVRRAGAGHGQAPRVSIWHGDADTTVTPANATQSERQWTSVHGLPPQPNRTDHIGALTRSVWLSPQTGEVVVESNRIKGLGHGAPLSTQGPEGLGAATAFMLEAGVSSSLDIAQFWGLAPAQADAPDARPQTTADQKRKVGLMDQVMASVADHVSPEVRAVIAKALKAAGLGR